MSLRPRSPSPPPLRAVRVFDTAQAIDACAYLWAKAGRERGFASVSLCHCAAVGPLRTSKAAYPSAGLFAAQSLTDGLFLLAPRCAERASQKRTCAYSAPADARRGTGPERRPTPAHARRRRGGCGWRREARPSQARRSAGRMARTGTRRLRGGGVTAARTRPRARGNRAGCRETRRTVRRGRPERGRNRTRRQSNDWRAVRGRRDRAALGGPQRRPASGADSHASHPPQKSPPAIRCQPSRAQRPCFSPYCCTEAHYHFYTAKTCSHS